MTGFNPQFSFGLRRASQDVTGALPHEREPLLSHEGAVETNAQEHDNPYAFLDPEWQEKLPVFRTIHRIRREIIANIDDPYSYEQLRGPRLIKQVVRPLIDRLYDPKDISIVFCLLANRVRFSREGFQAKQQSISHSRGLLCELIAIRILRRFSEDYRGVKGLLVIANVLVAGFDTFQNAPTAIAEEHSRAFRWVDEGKIASERKLTALEVAIISESKNLLSCRQCQHVVEAIYQGKIIYTPTSFINILPDHYKYKSIRLYNPRESPLLDQYRLVVPRTRYYLEIFHFIVLVALYVLQMETRQTGHFTATETLFCVFAFGWMLDQCATVLEHGWSVYTQNLWTYLDVSFSASFLLYFVLRLVGRGASHPATTEVAFDVLAMGAPFLVPRLAFNVLSENMLFVSLREMMSNFVVLTLLAVWSFGGFLLASSWMSRGLHSPLTIAKWMLWLWFGLDAEGIQISPEFHWLLGPVLMISFAFLGNTLFLTILVSMLSNTFATITANTEAEIQYRRTVVTFEGVKADAIFSFPPPFNLLALFCLLPLKPLLTPRYFHKTIVYAVRTLNAPILLLISFWERRALWAESAPKWYRALQQRLYWDLSSMAVHGDLVTVFEADPDPDPGPEGPQQGRNGSPVGPHGALPWLNLPGADGAPGAAADPQARKDSLAMLFGGLGAGAHGHAHRLDLGPRKESLAPFSEVAEHLGELLQEHLGNLNRGGQGGQGNDRDGGSGGLDTEETKARLDALEASLGRVETSLAMICERVGVMAEDDEEEEEGGDAAANGGEEGAVEKEVEEELGMAGGSGSGSGGGGDGGTGTGTGTGAGTSAGSAAAAAAAAER